jgi:hypothetical protein
MSPHAYSTPQLKAQAAINGMRLHASLPLFLAHGPGGDASPLFQARQLRFPSEYSKRNIVLVGAY